MSLVRFCMLLALVVWLGGIVFFAFVLAPTVFAVLPTRELAGNVVSRSLTLLHGMGVISGIIFAFASMLHSRLSAGTAQPLSARHLLVYGMIVLTLVSQFAVSGKMAALRTEMGVIDNLPQNDARRLEFNRLHQWSTRLEGAVLLLGLTILYLTARRLG
jgi:uncharacterized membrane protein